MRLILVEIFLACIFIDLVQFDSVRCSSRVKGLNYTVHLRTNLDRTKIEHRWKQHQKKKGT